MDFVERLGPDVAYSVFLNLGDHGDLVRAAAVSRSWRRFVIANGFCKDLIFRSYPEVLDLSHAVQVDIAGHSNSSEWDNLERQHKIYAQFGWHLSLPSARHNCITQAIAASSTDNDELESIENTLDTDNMSSTVPSYWSSSGSKDPGVPETLTYQLSSTLCVVDQINIMPFGAYFQYGHPIYSAEAVRFKMGYSTLPIFSPANSAQPEGSEFVWTYVSPAFQMVQAEILQPFKLPRPVICLGGLLQIELLGRVQTQEIDDLYYICLSFVEVIGWPLPPAFEVGFYNASGKLSLRYFAKSSNGTNQEKNGSYVRALEEWMEMISAGSRETRHQNNDGNHSIDVDDNDHSDEEPLDEDNVDDSDYEMFDDGNGDCNGDIDDVRNSGQEPDSDGGDYFSEEQPF